MEPNEKQQEPSEQQHEERRHTQQKYDGEDRRKEEFSYEKPVGDEPSDAPKMGDGGQDR